MSMIESLKENWKVVIPSVLLIMSLTGASVYVETSTDKNLKVLDTKFSEHVAQARQSAIGDELEQLRWRIEDIQRQLVNAKVWGLKDPDVRALQEQLRLLQQRQQALTSKLKAG